MLCNFISNPFLFALFFPLHYEILDDKFSSNAFFSLKIRLGHFDKGLLDSSGL